MSKKLAIIFGANSYEHEISIVSAIGVKKILDSSSQFDISYIFVDFANRFYLLDTSSTNTKTFLRGEYKKYPQLTLSQGGFLAKSFIFSKSICFDVVLNLIHGQYGEDGAMASLLDIYNIPAITPSMEACQVSYNKLKTKDYANMIDVKTLPYEYHISDDEIKPKTIKYPLILKPACAGSSLGISIVNTKDELEYAKDEASEYGRDILLEPFVKNIKEYNLAGCKIDGEFVYSTIEEPQKEEFLDFDKKYLDFSRDEKVEEAKISKSVKLKMQEAFAKIYNTTFEGSIIRCDFFVIDDEVYLNEINPIPGSMANYLFDDFESLFDKLCNEVIKKTYKKTKEMHSKANNYNYKYINKIQSNK